MRHKSFRAAADELSVTPQAVSLQVKLLEDSLGVELFERKGRAIEPNEHAILLAHFVQAAFEELAEGVRRAVAAWGMRPCAALPDLYSDTVTAVVVPAGANGTDLVKLAAEKYGVAFGVGLGEVAGKVFRIGHLGMLTDVMVLGGLATAEMCMADLGWNVRLGSGVAAAAEFYRGSAVPMAMAAE